MTVFQGFMNLIADAFLAVYDMMRNVGLWVTPTMYVTIMDIVFMIVFIKIVINFASRFTSIVNNKGKAGE